MTLKFSTLFALAALVCGMARAAVPAPMPPLAAADLNGKAVDLAAQVSGSAGVFIVGFTKASSDPSQAWEDRLWAAHPQGDACRVFSVLQLEGVPSFMMPFVRGSVRGKTPQARWARVFLARADKAQWKQYVGFDPSAPDQTYLVLFDAAGSPSWKGHGLPGPALQTAFETAFKALSAPKK